MQAEDMVEEGFIKLWSNREKIETEAGLRGYLYTTVYHACLRSLENEVRKERVYKLYKVNTERSIDDDKGVMENMIKAETIRLVKEEVERLPGECKKVFVKLYVEGKSVVETAEELKIAVSTVKNQKARGIKLLKAKLTT